MKRLFPAWIVLLSAVAALQALPASADLYPQYRPFALFPDCHSSGVLARIVDRSNQAERTTFHYGVEIQGIDRMQERFFEEFGPAPILRRYCRAYAQMSDGKARTVHYRIEKGMGLAGTGYKVEFCVQGLDRWRVYNGNCRVLRR